MDKCQDFAAQYRNWQTQLEALQVKITLTQLDLLKEKYLDTPNDLGDTASLLHKIRAASGIVETMQLRMDRRIDSLSNEEAV